MHSAAAGQLVEMTAAKDKVYCWKCGSDRVYRVERKGFMQEMIYPLLGLYPWRCKSCGDRAMLRKRNRARMHHKKSVESVP